MNGRRNDDSLLSPFRALDLTDEKGSFCGKVLADMGVDVVKVERPGGDPSRNIGPFYHNTVDPEKSLFWFAYNSNKRGITLDIETAAGQQEFKRLVAAADFVIESFPPGYMDKLGLGYAALSRINPRIIMTSITPYGQTGPYRDYKGYDIQAMAAGGLMYITGDPDRPPVRVSFPQSYLLAGIEASVGTLAAHYHREATGHGQYVDVSMQESVCLSLTYVTIYWEFLKICERRIGPNRRGMGGGGYRLTRLFWPCRDGYVTFTILGGAAGAPGAAGNRALVAWMDSEGAAPDFLKSENWDTLDIAKTTDEHLDRLMGPISQFFLKHTRAELHEEAVRRGVMLYPNNSAKEVVADPQLRSRGYWTDVRHPELGATITYPQAPVKCSETPIVIRRRAPLIGEHNQDVRREWLQLGRELPPLAAGTAGSDVFAGVKVADFSWAVAGACVSKYLAQHGAEVIHVESGIRLDPLRNLSPFGGNIPGPDRAVQFALYNNDKYGVSLNMRHPQAAAIFKEMVARSDIVVENFTPGTLKKWGLDYEALKKVRPDIIMLSSCNQGQTGPHAAQGGLGFHLASLPGLIDLTGWPDRPSSNIYCPYTDVVAPRYGVLSLMAALDYRRRTGKGQYIDLSQYEATIMFLLPVILNYTANGQVVTRDGNHSPCAAPHGAYPCRGQDRWCAIAVTTDREWRSFGRAIGDPPWTQDPRFATLSGRKAHEDELDGLVGKWTANLTPEEAVAILQGAGVAAAVVENCDDLFQDAQLQHRRHFVKLEHSVIGKHNYEQPAYRLSQTPAQLRRAAPCLGQDNRYVYCQLLGMPEARFAELAASHAFD